MFNSSIMANPTSYNPTDFEDQVGRYLREDFQDRMRKRLGDQHFERYLQVLNQHEEKIQRDQSPFKGMIGIDL